MLSRCYPGVIQVQRSRRFQGAHFGSGSGPGAGGKKIKDFKMKIDFRNSDGLVNNVMVFLYFIQQMPTLNAVSSYLMRETSRLT